MIYIMGKNREKQLLVLRHFRTKGKNSYTVLEIKYWYEKGEDSGLYRPTGGKGGSAGVRLNEEQTKLLARILPKILERPAKDELDIPDEGLALRTTVGIYIPGKVYESEKDTAAQLKEALATIAKLKSGAARTAPAKKRVRE